MCCPRQLSGFGAPPGFEVRDPGFEGFGGALGHGRQILRVELSPAGCVALRVGEFVGPNRPATVVAAAAPNITAAAKTELRFIKIIGLKPRPSGRLWFV
ncbi:MAG: hypothetical protein WCQ21_28460, partial [Verrucomicrobiota bacterium]